MGLVATLMFSCLLQFCSFLWGLWGGSTFFDARVAAKAIFLMIQHEPKM